MDNKCNDVPLWLKKLHYIIRLILLYMEVYEYSDTVINNPIYPGGGGNWHIYRFLRKLKKYLSISPIPWLNLYLDLLPVIGFQYFIAL